jgi:hypothetical protein
MSVAGGNRPKAACHSVLSIFHIAVTHPASYWLDGCSQSLAQTARRELAAALLHGVTFINQGG